MQGERDAAYDAQAMLEAYYHRMAESRRGRLYDEHDDHPMLSELEPESEPEPEPGPGQRLGPGQQGAPPMPPPLRHERLIDVRPRPMREAYPELLPPPLARPPAYGYVDGIAADVMDTLQEHPPARGANDPTARAMMESICDRLGAHHRVARTPSQPPPPLPPADELPHAPPEPAGALSRGAPVPGGPFPSLLLDGPSVIRVRGVRDIRRSCRSRSTTWYVPQSAQVMQDERRQQWQNELARQRYHQQQRLRQQLEARQRQQVQLQRFEAAWARQPGPGESRCRACGQVFGDADTLQAADGCTHVFCRPCLADFVVPALSHHLTFPPRCCVGAIRGDAAQQVLGPDDWLRWRSRESLLAAIAAGISWKDWSRANPHMTGLGPGTGIGSAGTGAAGPPPPTATADESGEDEELDDYDDDPDRGWWNEWE